MDEQAFFQNFRRAHELALAQARRFVAQDLPDDKRFLLRSATAHPLTEEQAVALLWRDSNDTTSICVVVKAQDEHFTYIEVLRFGKMARGDPPAQHEVHAPFVVLVPAPPFEWRHQSPEERGKFDLYWQRHEPFTPVE